MASSNRGADAGNVDDAFEEVRAGDRLALWQLIRSYGRPVAPQFLVGAVAGILSRATELVPAFVLGLAIDALFFDSRPFALPFVPAGWIPPTPRAQLYLVVGLVGGAYVFGALLGWVNSWAWNSFSQHLQHAVRTDTYDAVQTLELGFFDDRQTGEIMSVLNNDVNQLENFLTDRMNTGIRIVVRVGGMSLVMLALNWQLALVPIALIPALAVISYAFVRIIAPKYRAVRSSVGALNSRLENNIGGIEVLKAANAESFEYERVADASRNYLDAQWDAITTKIAFFPVLRIVTAVGYVATLLIGGIWVLSGPPAPFSDDLTFTAGMLVTFLLYTRRFVWPMRQFGEVVNEYEYAEAAGERIVGLLEEPRTIDEADDAVDIGERAALAESGSEGDTGVVDDRGALAESGSGGAAGEIVGLSVEFDDVTFRYDGGQAPGEGSRTPAEGARTPADGDRGPAVDGSAPDTGGVDRAERADDPVLSGVSFEVEPGEFVGVVGPTGAGKTTLVKLLMRLYDVDSGAVRVGGLDVRDVTLESLREQISYVSQEPFLFAGTVRENVAYGRPSVDDARMYEAARLAGAHEFVTELPEGYDTLVGERGVKLSGGQRQRLSLARAVLRDPSILVLDEATSHVDNETELEIQRSLADIAEDRTTFAIAHRLSTVRNADRILVLDDGELVESGTHEALLDLDGLYANLWRVQVGELDALPEGFLDRTVRRPTPTWETD